jgi:hypothetical protein
MGSINSFRGSSVEKHRISFSIFVKSMIPFLVIVSAGCATRGPIVLESCLKDDEIMTSYLEFQDARHGNFLVGGRAYLTAGFHERTNTVNCYWQTHNLASDMLSPNSNPLSRCYSQGNDKCAILMDGSKKVFTPLGKETNLVQVAPHGVNSVGVPEEEVKRANNTARREIDKTKPSRMDQSEVVGNTVKVIFHLLGAFAEGYANGLAEKSVSVRERVENNSGQVKKVFEPLPQEKPLKCTRNLVPGPTGYGYTCTRGI